MVRKNKPRDRVRPKAAEGIRMTIHVEEKVYAWLVKEKRQSGETYGQIVNKVIKSESNRRKNAQ